MQRVRDVEAKNAELAKGAAAHHARIMELQVHFAWILSHPKLD